MKIFLFQDKKKAFNILQKFVLFDYYLINSFMSTATSE